MSPRSPIGGGNDYFLGAGQHLPGGGPEMVIDSIPTKNTGNSKVISKVKVD